MSVANYPFRLNNQAIELNIAWMDKWFKSELYGVSGGKRLALEETTKRLLRFYRSLENAVEEEALNLGIAKEPKFDGTDLIIVAPELPTYQVAMMANRAIRISKEQSDAGALDLQGMLEEEKTLWTGQEALLESSKVAFCSNFRNVTAYNWFFTAPVANRLFEAQIDYRDRLRQIDTKRKFEWAYSVEDEWGLWASLCMVSHEMLSTLIGDAQVHENPDYDKQIAKKLAERFDALLKKEKSLSEFL